MLPLNIFRDSARLSCAEGNNTLSCPEAEPADTDSGGGGLASGVIVIIAICAAVGIVGVAVAAWACLRDSQPGEKAIEM